MPGPLNRVIPVASVGDGNYTDDRLGIPEMDIDNMIEGSVETRFGMNGDIEEGVSGRLKIDAEYENYSETYFDTVRSDVTRYEDNPAAHDVAKHKYPHRRY